jgi:hypothetical protein
MKKRVKYKVEYWDLNVEARRTDYYGGYRGQSLERGNAVTKVNKNKQTPWPEPASELYRPRDCRLSAKLVPTLADRGVSRSQRGGSPTAVISVF